MEDILMRTWADVSLDSIAHNYKQIREKLHTNCKVLGIVKADAYGHGAVAVSELLAALGADYLGVSSFDEAMQLRDAGIALPILILGFTPAEFTGKLLEENLTQTVFSLEQARQLSENAQKLGKKLKVHVKVDTGMTRLGFLFNDDEDRYETVRRIAAVCALEGLETEGLFTHFANADVKDDPHTLLQFSRFISLTDTLEKAGIHFAIKHCANSAAMINYPQTQLDMVRPGLILYGVYPAADMQPDISLRPAMSLRSVVSQIKDVEAETPVSYGCKYFTKAASRIAVVAVGYADGLMRVLSNGGQMLIHGVPASITGTICMDMCMADVSHIPDVRAGDTVTLFGCDSGGCLPVEQLAQCAGTIAYELICLISKRVPRFYYRDGIECGHKNYIR